MFTEEDLVAESKDEYLEGRYSPVLLAPKDLPPDTFVYDPDEDMLKLTKIREQLISTGSVDVSGFF